MKFVKIRKEDLFDYTVERTCKNCGTVFYGRYCNRCGEKVFEPQDKSLSEIFFEFLKGIAFVDNRFFRTMRLMFLKSGELSIQYMNGVRVRFIRPISIFFIANLLYFLFPVFDTFNSGLRTQMHFLPHSAIAKRMVEERLEAENYSLKEFDLRYRQQSTSMAKLLLIIFVFLVAVPLALINFSSRFYFYDHFLVSLEYNSLLIIVSQIILPRLFMAFNYGFFRSDHFIKVVFNDSFYTMIVAIFSLALFFIMEKRVYGQDNGRASVKAILLILSLFIALQTYRIILFFVTMATL